ILRQCAHRTGSVAPARCLGAQPDRRGLRIDYRSRKLDDALRSTVRPERFWELSPAAVRPDGQPGDGRVPQHARQYKEQRKRELRPRDSPAFLDRVESIE